MTNRRDANRRTVLKTIGAGVVGGLASIGTASATAGRGRGRGPKNVVEIIARHPPDDDDRYEFVLSDDEIEPGWTTFDFVNEAGSTHFGFIVELSDVAVGELEGHSEGDTLAEKYMNAAALPFQEAWNDYYEGEITAGDLFAELFMALPEWFLTETTASGGPGLTGGGRSSKTTMNLTEGTYLVECYVLDLDGVFHTTHGMIETFEVTGGPSKMAEPEPTLDVSISTGEGIVFDDADVRLGRQTVGITFEDNKEYDHGLGHDVHLIRLEEGTTASDVNAWMDYLDVGPDGYYADSGGLTSSGDAPGPETFLGGVQDVFPGEVPETAYFEVTLSPGDYAWIAEVPDPAGEDLLQEFTVSPPGRR